MSETLITYPMFLDMIKLLKLHDKTVVVHPSRLLYVCRMTRRAGHKIKRLRSNGQKFHVIVATLGEIEIRIVASRFIVESDTAYVMDTMQGREIKFERREYNPYDYLWWSSFGYSGFTPPSP